MTKDELKALTEQLANTQIDPQSTAHTANRSQADLGALTEQLARTQIDPHTQFYKNLRPGTMNTENTGSGRSQNTVPRQAISLYQKWFNWFNAQDKELIHTHLPESDEDLKELSSFMSTEIERNAENRGRQYIPPIPPFSHPCFPYWLPDGHDGRRPLANQIISEAHGFTPKKNPSVASGSK